MCYNTAIFGVFKSREQCYSSCVKIRCQETDNGDSNGLRTLVFAAVTRELRGLAVALYFYSSEWCIQVANKSIHPIRTPSDSDPYTCQYKELTYCLIL
jgi:hypothetical protein